MSATAGLEHEWLSDKNWLVLRIPAISADGFDVELEARPKSLELRCGRMHTPLDSGPDPATAVQDALGLVRDLLTPAMRLREKCAGGYPYRWFLETRAPTGWVVEHEMGLVLWNVLGRRSERTYLNAHLPTRDE